MTNSKSFIGDAPASHVIAQMCEMLDSKFEKWDIYRTFDKKWRLVAEKNKQKFETTSICFVSALDDAINWVPLPIVPRPPVLFCRDGFSIIRNGAKWRLDYLGSDCHVQFRTKRDAELYVDKQDEQSRRSLEEWEKKYGWTKSKQEEIDYRFAQ